MALTPEDVVNKRFQPTKFREGYDQDEVDDFLDEVVVELRRLNQENEELRQRLIASDSRINELQRAGVQAAQPQQAPQPMAQPQQPMAQPQQPYGQPEPMPAAAYPAPPIDSNSMDPGNTNNLLQLARRLHEEHVREGVEKRDTLIAEGHATAARLVSDAEGQQRAQIASLDEERQALEHRIEDLRTFEREYRTKLKGYIEGQLRDLNSANAITAGTTPASVPQYADAPSAQYADVASAQYGAQTPPPPAPYSGFAGS